MNICFLAPASVIHTVRWVNALVDRGHEISLITMHPPKLDTMHPNVKIYNLRIPAPIGYYLNYIQTRKIINRIKPDIVNAHYASGYGTLARLVNFHPTLLSVWGSDVYDFPYESKIKMKIIKKNLESATQIASTSFAMKKQVERLITPRLPIEVTPFGIDTNMFFPNRDKKEKDIITIGIVKKLEEKYGVRHLIEAVSLLIGMLKENNQEEIASKIRLLIVGEGSQLEELKLLTKRLNISEITTFVGAVPHDQVPSYLNKLDIYCAPSTLDSESFGVAIIEASACELPVVVSDVGGFPEVVKDGETGYIVERKNSKAIAKRLYELVQSPQKRGVLGKNGRNFVESLYNWDDNVRKMESVYQKLIDSK
ncbi:Glycosyltransferase [Anoxybacillus flavithermus]|uniref:glycosyltransferase n=1 Tax=Anoxybacillus flavithermus TaxID=33934 RepID=UPI0007DA304E|nr:glycosyltransferase [Anoxybacillus flavithermus]OAO83531.1 Glycosyltransferase [Anoxybacillus flavithermus]